MFYFLLTFEVIFQKAWTMRPFGPLKSVIFAAGGVTDAADAVADWAPGAADAVADVAGDVGDGVALEILSLLSLNIESCKGSVCRLKGG